MINEAVLFLAGSLSVLMGAFFLILALTNTDSVEKKESHTDFKDCACKSMVSIGKGGAGDLKTGGGKATEFYEGMKK